MDDAAVRRSAHRRCAPSSLGPRGAPQLPVADQRRAFLHGRLRGAQAHLSAAGIPPRHRAAQRRRHGARRSRVRPQPAGGRDALADRHGRPARHAQRHRRPCLDRHAQRRGDHRRSTRPFRWCAASAPSPSSPPAPTRACAGSRAACRTPSGARACRSWRSTTCHGTCASCGGTWRKQPRWCASTRTSAPSSITQAIRSTARRKPWPSGAAAWRRSPPAPTWRARSRASSSKASRGRSPPTARSFATPSPSSASSAACSRPTSPSTASRAAGTTSIPNSSARWRTSPSPTAANSSARTRSRSIASGLAARPTITAGAEAPAVVSFASLGIPEQRQLRKKPSTSAVAQSSVFGMASPFTIRSTIFGMIAWV